MTSSTKPEMHNVLHSRQRRTEPQSRLTCAGNFVKSARVDFEIYDYASGQTSNIMSPGPRPSYQVASWSIQPFGHNRHGPKIGGLYPFLGGSWVPHLTQCGQGLRVPPCQVSSWSIQLFGHSISTLQTDRQTGQTTVR